MTTGRRPPRTTQSTCRARPCIEISHDGQRDREDRPATQALDPAEQDQLPHLLAETAQDGADQEQADREDDDRPAPEEVRQPAVDRAADRGRQQIDRDDPGVEGVPVEVGDDDRECGADHGLVEREQEQRQEDRAEDLQLRAELSSIVGSLVVRRGVIGGFG